MISAKHEPDAPISPAMDGLFRIHKRIADGSDGESGQPQRSAGNIGPTRLLVPASQAGSLIGKQGATIKSIQDSSKSVVRILEYVPPVALNDDSCGDTRRASWCPQSSGIDSESLKKISCRPQCSPAV